MNKGLALRESSLMTMLRFLQLTNENLGLAAILVAAVILRLTLVNSAFHVDLVSIAYWGEWIYKFSPKGFYENSQWIYSWPTQPPLANLFYGFSFYIYQQLVWLFSQIALIIATYRLAPTYFLWWFAFVKWFGIQLYAPTTLLTGFLITLKFFGILADLAIGGIIYLLARRVSLKWTIYLALAYLFSPFSWYLSSLWGQHDQLGFLFTLLAFVFLIKKYLYFAPALFLFSVLLKPTFLIFSPLFVWAYFKSKPDPMKILVGILSSVGLFILTTSVFTNKNLFEFVSQDLVRIIFQKAEFRISTNSFNFWHILIGNQALNQNTPILFIPAKIWGYCGFATLNALAFHITKKLNWENLFKAMFIVGAGSWLFLTNMLERYFFAGVTSLLLLSIYQPKLFKYWIFLSLIFWLNLYHGWWFPESLDFLKQALTWHDGLVTRALSLINVVVFLRIFWVMFKTKHG